MKGGEVYMKLEVALAVVCSTELPTFRYFKLLTLATLIGVFIKQEGQHPLAGQRPPISGYWPTSEPNAG